MVGVGILKHIVQRVMAMDLTTKDVKLRVAKLFNLSEDEAARVIIRARSELKKPRVREAKRKIVFIPQCLRKRECKAPLTEEGFQCQACSADCQARLIREAALSGGASCFIVPGGTMVRNLIAKYSPDAVIGIACHKEAEEGLNECDKAGVPAVGVLLLRDGCVNTLVDFEEVKTVLEDAGLACSTVEFPAAFSAASTPLVLKPKSD
ncbi:MAG: DUF116 domain-containing protein [Candidatus Norongarragalinales archaeon]